MNIYFQDYYFKFSEDESEEVKLCAARSLHEAFKIAEDDDDISSLRRCFVDFLTEEEKEIQYIMNDNLSTIIKKYCNKNTMDTFKGRTPYIDSSNSDSESKEQSPNVQAGHKTTNEFPNIAELQLKGKKTSLHKKNNSIIGLQTNRLSESEQDTSSVQLPPIYVTSENQSEEVYSDLLQRLMVFVNNIKNNCGSWREHVKLLNHIKEVIHLFYMPEIH